MAWIGVASLSISALVAMVMLARGDTTPAKKAPPAAAKPALHDSDGCARSLAPPDSMRRSDLPIIASRPTKILVTGGTTSRCTFGECTSVVRYVDVRGDVYESTPSAGAGALSTDTREGFDLAMCATREYLGTLRREDTIDLAAYIDRGKRCVPGDRECRGVMVPALVDGNRIVIEIVDDRTPEGASAERIYGYTYEL